MDPLGLTPEQLASYGRILFERRSALGLSLRRAGDLADLTHTTLRDIERGKRAPTRPITYRKMDKIYGYLEGSVYNLYNSGQQPVAADAPAPATPPRLPITDFPVVLPLKSVIELVEAEQQFEERANASGDQELVALQKTFSRCTDRLLRAWIIAQIEGRRAAGYEDDHFISTLLAAQLARKPIADDDHDRDELTYLRWLLGRAGDLPPQEEARYADLFAARTQQGRADADA